MDPEFWSEEGPVQKPQVPSRRGDHNSIFLQDIPFQILWLWSNHPKRVFLFLSQSYLHSTGEGPENQNLSLNYDQAQIQGVGQWKEGQGFEDQNSGTWLKILLTKIPKIGHPAVLAWTTAGVDPGFSSGRFSAIGALTQTIILTPK